MSFSDTWPHATVEDQPDRTQPPEPGLYTAVIRDAKAITAKNSGKDFVILEFEGIDGAAAQHQWSVLQGFGSEQQASITKRVVRDIGVDIDNIASLDDLDQAVKAAIGSYFTVRVKQNGDYRNTYIDGPAKDAQTELPAAAATAPAGNATAGDDDDIPF